MTPEDFNPSVALERSRIDPTEEVGEPISAIQINSNEGFTPSLTLGNFSMVTGKAKSKKTFLIGAISAAAITGETTIGVFQGVLPVEKRNVIYFDTEQSRPHTIISVRRIIALSGGEISENFTAYSLRRYNPDQRLQMIEKALESHENNGIVFIDGGRDLLSLGINDERQATNVTSSFLRWTDVYNLHLCIVLHQNKVNTNLRGHFGTECMNKAEMVIRVTAHNNGSSVVSSDYSRYIPFKDFAFRINEEGLPESCSIPRSSTGTRNSSRPHTIEDTLHLQVLATIFEQNHDLRYTLFWNTIREKFHQEGINFGENIAKSYVPYYVDKGWVINENRTYTINSSD